ncbi:unnamed protein product, partial [Medioppia subpectinata]
RQRFTRYLNTQRPDIQRLFAHQFAFANFAVHYVQQELCSFSLREAIDRILAHFQLDHGQLLPTVGYYIMAELLYDLLVAIDCLHKNNPPIIHRQINPGNIMIKHNADAGTFVKLGGFGLATEHLNDDQSHTQCSGVDQYLAPEVRQGRRYDTKCDMYSLGVTVQHMFNFDANTLFQTEQELDTNYEKIKKQTLRLLNNVRNGRPSAQDLIIRHNEWSIPYASVRAHILAVIEPNASYDIDTQFVQYFLFKKYKFNKTK